MLRSRSPNRLLTSVLAGATALVAVALAPAALAAPPAGAPAKAGKSKVRILAQADLHKEIKKHRGRVVLLHFWATWCLPCLDELAVVADYAREGKARGLDVLSLSLDNPNDGPAKMDKTLAEHGATGLTRILLDVRDPQAFIESVDREWEGAIPAVFAIDGQGNFRGRYIGEAGRKELEELLGYLLKPAPAASAPGKAPAAAKP